MKLPSLRLADPAVESAARALVAREVNPAAAAGADWRDHLFDVGVGFGFLFHRADRPRRAMPLKDRRASAFLYLIDRRARASRAPTPA